MGQGDVFVQAAAQMEGLYLEACDSVLLGGWRRPTPVTLVRCRGTRRPLLALELCRMQLIGAEIPPAVTGGASQYLRLADVSVLLGANDVGKSRTMRCIHQGLRAEAIVPEQERDIGVLPRFFVNLGTEPSEWLMLMWELTSVERELLSSVSVFGREAAPTGVAVQEALEFATLTWGDEPRWVAANALRRLAGLEDEGWQPLFEFIVNNPMPALMAPCVDRGLAGWRLERCMLGRADMAPEVQVLADALDLASPGGDPAAPIPIGPLLFWLLSAVGLPEPRVVPMPAGALAGEAEAAVSRASANLRTAAGRTVSVPSTGPWLEPTADDAVRLSAEVRVVCEVLSRRVQERLPAFITRQHDLRIRPLPLADWGGGTQLVLEFHRRDLQQTFPVGDVAEGFRLWTEMTLLDGLHDLDAAMAELARHDQPMDDYAPGYHYATLLDENVAEHLRVDPNGVAQMIEGWIDDLAESWRIHRSFWSPESNTTPKPSVDSFLEGGRVFLVDEPERHLHPALQRHAARYLQELGTGAVLDSQVICATHSVAMLSMKPPVAYTHLGRPLGRMVATPLDPSTLQALDFVSGDLGFDRGELLTLSRVIAFVEGTVDAVVLCTLFGDRLRAAGVELVPMHGTTRMAAILEVDLLFDKLRQKVAVVLDNLVDGRIDPRDHGALRHLSRSRAKRDDEARKAAALLLAARERGRRVEVLGFPAPDVIRALDEDVLASCFGYPGHEVADLAWETATAKDPNVSWKAVAASAGWIRYDEESIQEVVTQMARRDAPAPLLEPVVERLEALADAL
jgi:hypothetical protein